jgi:prepilin-type N-terminal cleavage/methylation domain-containing protein
VTRVAYRARRGAPAGFTLLEIAIALAILGVGVVSVMQIFGASLRLQDRASRESRAVLHARAAMDALLFQPEIVDHTEERDTAEGFHTRVLVRHAGAEEGLTEKDLDFESEVSLRYLQVDVTWQDGVGKKTYTLKSLRMAPEVD